MDFVQRIINHWDPMDLLCHAPEDEYCWETEQIRVLLSQTEDPAELAGHILRIFKFSFGKDIFHKSIDECQRIAQLLLSEKDRQ